ncbi:hypothetical protein AKO1_015250 [Acrasis kona]|uniref:Uncharacterized protein n=1 Tax=Acrasis kona TaxID=1008807 RepID=A0AAW2ZFD9_9EUKA
MRRRHDPADYSVPPLDIGGSARIPNNNLCITKQDVLNILRSEQWFSKTIDDKQPKKNEVNTPLRTGVRVMSEKEVNKQQNQKVKTRKTKSENGLASSNKSNEDVGTTENNIEQEHEGLPVKINKNHHAWEEGLVHNTEKEIQTHINNPKYLQKHSITDNRYSHLPPPRENTTRIIPDETFASSLERHNKSQINIEDYGNTPNTSTQSEHKPLGFDTNNNNSNTPYIKPSVPIASVWTDQRFASHNLHSSGMKKLEKMYEFDYSQIFDMAKYTKIKSSPNLTNSYNSSYYSNGGGLSIKKQVMLHHTK